MSYALEVRGLSRVDRSAEAARLCQLVGLTPGAFLKKYPKELSGGETRRVAIGMALGAKANVLLFDEPTAQLDVRGEAEIFERLLEGTRRATTILISHRFSTVRHADRICVLEHGRVVELGSHDELMALGGRYRTMFDLQAARFEDEEEKALDVLQ